MAIAPGSFTPATLILIDDCARFVTGHGVDDAERAEMVIRTFEEAVARHGKPELVMHDRGAAFWSWRGISRFTALLTELGIDQVVAEDKEPISSGSPSRWSGSSSTTPVARRAARANAMQTTSGSSCSSYGGATST